MSQRETNLLWLKDTLEQLTATQQQLEWTSDPETNRVLTEAMIRDLERCTRLCSALQRRSYQTIAV
jgi:hypothetical protein